MTWPSLHFYCINLRHNTQRWVDSIPQFQQAGISYVERVVFDQAEDNRWLGFNRSMFAVLQKGYATGNSFVIFEDDIMFDNVTPLETAFSQLPEDFDLLYLGGNIFGDNTWPMPTKYSSHLCHLNNAWQSHAIMYSNKAAKYVLDNFNPEGFPVLDEWLRVNLMTKGKCYLANPMVCWQRAVFSDLWQRQVEYGCHVPGNLILSKL